MKHKLTMTFIDEKLLKSRNRKKPIIRSTEYDWLKKEEDELEEWQEKKRKKFYKMARKLTNSASSIL